MWWEAKKNLMINLNYKFTVTFNSRDSWSEISWNRFILYGDDDDDHLSVITEHVARKFVPKLSTKLFEKLLSQDHQRYIIAHHQKYLWNKITSHTKLRNLYSWLHSAYITLIFEVLPFKKSYHSNRHSKSIFPFESQKISENDLLQA